LTPVGYSESCAQGISGTQQVGWGKYVAAGNKQRALVWEGNAESFIDLNPDTWQFSLAIATNGTQQVGWGRNSAGYNRAMAWSGTSQSFIDLSQFLPNGYGDAYAYGIDSMGNIIGYAETIWGSHAIMWEPVPEPATLLLLTFGGLLLRKRN
jgi:hypothetical protein